MCSNLLLEEKKTMYSNYHSNNGIKDDNNKALKNSSLQSEK